MNKTQLLLASLLKPVNDSRAFEKLGLSISKLPGVEVHICGYKAVIPATEAKIIFHPIFDFPRLSSGRIIAQLKYLKLLFYLKPKVIIIGTHELLISSLIYKALKSCDLIYDVQENYYLNMTSQKVYAPLIRKLAAEFIRLVETLTAPFINFFFLAEESYVQELPFIRHKYLVLQNKFKPAPHFTLPKLNPGTKIPSSGNVNMLYSGTISELYGIFEAIRLVDTLNQISPRYTLTIIGYWPQAAIGQQVKKLIRNKPFISLIGGDNLVAHAQIIQVIASAQVGLLPYHPHPSLVHCLPTKLFEYLAHSLPILVQENPYWEKIITEHQAGFSVDFNNPDPAAIIRNLEQNTFYHNIASDNVYWNSEEAKLLQFLSASIL